MSRPRLDGAVTLPAAARPADYPRAVPSVADSRSVLLVEGASDRVALEVVATRRGLDLAGCGVEILVIGGAHAVGRVLGELRAQEHPPSIGVLCDRGEAAVARRALGGDDPDGLFVCVADLEDELIRGNGVEVVEAVIEREGDGGPFRTFIRQPAQRGRPRDAQLRRFLGTRAGRKERYARLLAESVALDAIPGALDAALRHAIAG